MKGIGGGRGTRSGESERWGSEEEEEGDRGREREGVVGGGLGVRGVAL